jgi:hypothetical protein
MTARVTADDFRKDPMFPRIARAVAALLAHGKVVAPVGVLVEMDILEPKDLEDWRFGRVPYLERVIRGSLSRLSRLLRILGYHCHDLNLVPSHTAYVKGQGPAHTPALHEDWREAARGDLRASFRVAGERAVSSAAREVVVAGPGLMSPSVPSNADPHERPALTAAIEEEEARIRRLEAEHIDAKARLTELRAKVAALDEPPVARLEPSRPLATAPRSPVLSGNWASMNRWAFAMAAPSGAGATAD